MGSMVVSRYILLTRIQACKDGTKKSVLDYILMQQSMYDKLVSVEIDEAKIYCPYRETISKGKRRIVYSDHCVMMVGGHNVTGQNVTGQNVTDKTLH